MTLSTISLYSMRIFILFAIVWSGLAAYQDLKALSPEGITTILVTVITGISYSYLLKDTWLLRTTLYLLAGLGLLYLTFLFGAPLALLVFLVFCGMAAYQS